MVLNDDEIDAVLHGWEQLRDNRVCTKPWPPHAFLNFHGAWCRADQQNLKQMGSVSERDPLIWEAFRTGGFRVADTIDAALWRDHMLKWFNQEKLLGNVKREREPKLLGNASTAVKRERELIVIEDTPPRLKKRPYGGGVNLVLLKRLMRTELQDRRRASELRQRLEKCDENIIQSQSDVQKEMDELNAPDEVYQEAMEDVALAMFKGVASISVSERYCF